MTAGRNLRCNFLRGSASIVNKFLIWCAWSNQPDVGSEIRGSRGGRSTPNLSPIRLEIRTIEAICLDLAAYSSGSRQRTHPLLDASV